MITAKIRKHSTGYQIPVYCGFDYMGAIWGDKYSVKSGITTEYDIMTFIDGDLAGIIHVNDYVCLTWMESEL